MVYANPNDIFQFSTVSAIKASYLNGGPHASDLADHGTDGLGVFESGAPMTLSNSQAYIVDENGIATLASPEKRLAFAMVTIFRPLHAAPTRVTSIEHLDAILSNPNVDHSPIGTAGGVNTLMPIQLEGKFKKMIINVPTPEGPKTFTAKDVRGEVFGFAVPSWMKELCGPRIHAHFLSEEIEPTGKTSGRISELEADGEVLISVGKCERFRLRFPQDPNWETLELGR